MGPLAGQEAARLNRYHCDRCGDDMASKFQNSHERICCLREQIESGELQVAKGGLIQGETESGDGLDDRAAD